MKTSSSQQSSPKEASKFDAEMEAYLIVAMLKNDVAPSEKNYITKDLSLVSVIQEETESQQNYLSKSSGVQPISPYEEDTE